MAQSKIHVAVIGLGMGRYHLETLKKNLHAEVTAVCDIRRELAETTAKQYQVERVYTDTNELLANKAIDAVIVALPVYLHHPVTLAALAAGKHVLVEKPMAESTAKAQEMLEAAAKQGLVLTINHNQRFDPVTIFLKDYIAQGQLGNVHFARCIWTRPYGVMPGPERSWFYEKEKGGGVLFDLGTHLLDKVLSLFNFPEPVQFAASSFTVLGKEQEARYGTRFDADDLTVGMVQFSNGMTIQLEMSFGSHIEKELLYFELYGCKGGVTTRDGLKLFSVKTGTLFVSTPIQPLPLPTNPTVPDDFIDAIIHRRPPVITPESAVKVTQVLEGLRAAAEKGWGKPTL